VTGASSGIGRAIAEACAAEGAEVLLTHRASPERAHAVAEAIAARGGRAEVCQADLATRDACERLVAEAAARLGRIDVWINNAGRGITRSVLDLTDEDIDEMIAVNVKSAIYGMQAAVPHFIERGEGHLINISSFLGRVPIAGFRSVYSAAKAALNSLTANLRMDLLAHPGVRVSLVMPGVVATDFARNVRGDARPPVNAGAPGASPMNPQTAEEVADRIVDVIQNPVAEVYTNPISAELARHYYADIAAFERASARAQAPGAQSEKKHDARI